MNGRINTALILIDRAISELEIGFVACETCGDQEDTKDLDCMDDLKEARAVLVAFAEESSKSKEDCCCGETEEAWRLCSKHKAVKS